VASFAFDYETIRAVAASRDVCSNYSIKEDKASGARTSKAKKWARKKWSRAAVQIKVGAGVIGI
jgi:hypothetical protein